MNDEYYATEYNTPLSADQALRFEAWLQAQSLLRGRNLANDLVNYDLQGYWLNGGDKDAGAGHMPDTFKKPNHPTFSTESKYSGTPDLWGGRFQGGQWGGSDEGGWAFRPSARMLKTTHTLDQLQQYFAENEPDSILLSPAVNARPGASLGIGWRRLLRPRD